MYIRKGRPIWKSRKSALVGTFEPVPCPPVPRPDPTRYSPEANGARIRHRVAEVNGAHHSPRLRGDTSVSRAHRTMHTTITRQQLADLISGIGSCYRSGGGYDGDAALTTLGAIAQALAEHVRLGPTEAYEIPPVRA